MGQKERFLFLTQDADLLQSQLITSQELFSDEFPDLIPNISTDGIYPAKAIQAPIVEYGRHALTGVVGFKEGTLQDNAPEIIVVGPGFGRGSSREQAATALHQAGIRRIICVGGQLERIFAENCLFSGIQTYELPQVPETLDIFYDLVEQDALEAKYQDQLRADIASMGGLSKYNKGRIRGEYEPYQIRHNELEPNHPMTATEKIIAAHMVNAKPNVHGQIVVMPGDTGFIKVDQRFSYEVFGPIIQQVITTNFNSYPLNNADNIHFFQDHTALFSSPAFLKMVSDQAEFAQRHKTNLHGQCPTGDQTEGICHTLIREKGLVVPGDILAGTDSHTDTSGVLNAFALGIGATHMANALITGEVLVEVPKTFGIKLSGHLSPETSPKDVMLYILSSELIKKGSSTGCVFEFSGDGLDDWSLEMQSVLTNMAVEGRATSGIITQLTPALSEHLQTVNGMTHEEIEAKFVKSDPDASFTHIIDIDLSKIEPMIALPPDPSNAIPIAQLEKRSVQNVYIGSCTGGNLFDLRQAAHVFKDKKISYGVTCYIQPASWSILKQAETEGIIDVLKSAGVQVLGLGCGACCGYGPGGSDGNTVATINRNFRGRMGFPEGQIYLTSAIHAANAALNGYIGN